MSVSWCSVRLMDIQNRSEIIFGGSSLFMAEYEESKSPNPTMCTEVFSSYCSESNDQRILKQKIVSQVS